MSKELLPVKRTNVGLRIALFDAINGVRTGKMSTNEALTIHKLATQIIELTKMEITNAAMLEHTKKRILIEAKK